MMNYRLVISLLMMCCENGHDLIGREKLRLWGGIGLLSICSGVSTSFL